MHEMHAIIVAEESNEMQAVVGRGLFKLAPDFVKFQLHEGEFVNMTVDDQLQHIINFLKAGASSVHRSSSAAFQPRDKRRGTKRGSRLSRAPPAHALPLSRKSLALVASCPPRSQNSAAASDVVDAFQRHWENNEEFFLEFVSPLSSLCAACDGPIAYVTAIPGHRLIVRHAEHYVYPTGPPGRPRWSTTVLSKHLKRNIYYHSKAACLLKRFSLEYFTAMPLRFGS